MGIKTYMLDYRLAPENPYPAALNDFVGLYKSLVLDKSNNNKIFIMADSSGCALALSGLQQLKSSNFGMPQALGLITPVVDFAKTGESFTTNKEADPYQLSEEYSIDHQYLKGLDTTNPTISPLYGDFNGFPPMLIHSAGCDVFQSDSEMLFEKATRQGVAIHYRNWPELWHNFHMSRSILDEGVEALQEIYNFFQYGYDAFKTQLLVQQLQLTCSPKE